MKTRILFLCMMFLPLTVTTVKAQEDLYRALKLIQGAYKAYKAYNLTDEEVISYAKEGMKEMDANNKICSSSSKYTIRLNKITKGMTTINGQKINFKVYYDETTANAFASPDGSVRVYSKLMDIMTDDEVLGIIGHELGHIAMKHSFKQYKTALYASAARDGLMCDDGTIGELAASTLGSLTEQLFNAKYSRAQETEADNSGYDFLKKHGRNPYAMAAALKKLDELENGPDNKYARYVATLFSTHPDIKNRVASLTARAQKDGYSTK